MSDKTANHTASPGLLTGWGAIETYTGKKARTLRRYRETMQFPVFRFGRHVVSDPQLIARWLIVIDEERRARKR